MTKRPENIKIISITSSIVESGMMIYGLGDDGVVYVMDVDTNS